MLLHLRISTLALSSHSPRAYLRTPEKRMYTHVNKTPWISFRTELLGRLWSFFAETQVTRKVHLPYYRGTGYFQLKNYLRITLYQDPNCICFIFGYSFIDVAFGERWPARSASYRLEERRRKSKKQHSRFPRAFLALSFARTQNRKKGKTLSCRILLTKIIFIQSLLALCINWLSCRILSNVKR